jgi:alkyl sulfatase BDS1-like metallo-beta-lactamase superfamily hydrolase
VDNPLDRYAIRDRSNMEPNPDGLLTIYIQSESPGKDKEARKLQPEVLSQMAYIFTGGSDRVHMMSQALALEGKVTLVRLIPPAPEAISASPTPYVDFFPVRIDPSKSGKTDSFIQFDFSAGTSGGLHIRRAVSEFVAEPDKYVRKPDVSVAKSGEDWAKLYLTQVTPEDIIKSGDINVIGNSAGSARLINLFDRYSPH